MTLNCDPRAEPLFLKVMDWWCISVRDLEKTAEQVAEQRHARYGTEDDGIIRIIALEELVEARFTETEIINVLITIIGVASIIISIVLWTPIPLIVYFIPAFILNFVKRNLLLKQAHFVKELKKQGLSYSNIKNNAFYYSCELLPELKPI